MKLSAARTTFLVGSGISIESGLPSGMAFSRRLAKVLAESPTQTRQINRLLVLDDSARGHSRIRFEALIQLLRSHVDPELHTFDVFDSDVAPNSVHDFLARSLRDGAIVFTTNFDSLIEKAYATLFHNASGRLVVACVNERSRGLPGCSFRDLSSRAQRVLFKLHGSLSLELPFGAQRLVRTPDLLASIGATLDQIGAAGAALRLEYWKHRALLRQTKGKTLVVLGYSGIDDFDVIPSLCEAIRSVRRLIWIVHNNCTTQVFPSSTTHLPQALASAASAARVDVTVIRGRTRQVIEKIFRRKMKLAPPHGTPMFNALVGPTTLRSGERAFLVGRIFHHAAKYRLALASYRRAKRWFLREGDRNRFARIVEWEAIAHFSLGDTIVALRRIKHAISSYRRAHDLTGYADALIEYSRMLNRLGKVGTALRLCMRGRSLLQRLRNDPHLVRALIQESDLHNRVGQVGQAIRCTHAALKLSRKLRDRLGEAAVLMTTSALLRERGHFSRAANYIKRAQRLYHLLGNRSALGSAYITEGNIHLQHGELDQAMLAYRSALKLATASNRKTGVAIATANIGIVLRTRGRVRSAIRRYNQSLSINEAVNNPEGVARDSENIGICYLDQHNWREADKWLTRSLAINRKMDNQEKVAISLNNLAASLRQQGNHGLASRYVSQALSINRRLGRPLGIASALQNRAELHYAMGQRARAFDTAEKALQIAQRHGFRVVQLDSAKLLTRISIDRKQRIAALRTLKVADTAAKSLGDRKRIRELVALRNIA